MAAALLERRQQKGARKEQSLFWGGRRLTSSSEVVVQRIDDEEAQVRRGGVSDAPSTIFHSGSESFEERPPGSAASMPWACGTSESEELAEARFSWLLDKGAASPADTDDGREGFSGACQEPCSPSTPVSMTGACDDASPTILGEGSAFGLVLSSPSPQRGTPAEVTSPVDVDAAAPGGARLEIEAVGHEQSVGALPGLFSPTELRPRSAPKRRLLDCEEEDDADRRGRRPRLPEDQGAGEPPASKLLDRRRLPSSCEVAAPPAPPQSLPGAERSTGPARVGESAFALRFAGVEPSELLARCASTELRPHQLLACQTFLRGRCGRLLLQHDVGGGKTRTALTLARCLLEVVPELRIYVLAPRTNLDHFKRENASLGRRRVNFRRVAVMTEAAFQKLWGSGAVGAEGQPFAVFVDEAQSLRGGSANGKLLPRGRRAAAVMEATERALAAVLLTATPVMNDPEEFFNAYSVLTNQEPRPRDCLAQLSSRSRWRSQLADRVSVWCDQERAGYPAVTEERVRILLEGPALQVYNEREVESNQGFCAATTADDLVKNPTVFLNSIRRACCEAAPKTSYVAAEVLRNAAAGQRTLVYSSWLDAGLRPIAARLFEEGVAFAEITGQHSAEEVEQAKESYNAGRVAALLVSGAGATGLDLKGTEHVIIVDPPWNESQARQVVGRAARYRSHDKLEPERRRVAVQRLVLVKDPARPVSSGRSRVVVKEGLGLVRWLNDEGGRGGGSRQRFVYWKTADEYVGNRSAEKDVRVQKFYAELRGISRRAEGDAEASRRRSSSRDRRA